MGCTSGASISLEPSTTTRCCRRGSARAGVPTICHAPSIPRRRASTPLAGADLNADGNGGAFPPDRARVNPADESTSVGRNSETSAAQITMDVRVSRKFRISGNVAIEGILEAFNLFNRDNFFEDTNQSSFVIFGTGAYPNNPLPTYGKYSLTLPPRQVQIAAKI